MHLSLEDKKKALTFLQAGQFTDALNVLGNLDGVDDAECWFFAGCAHMAINDDRAAEEAFNQAIKYNPDLVQAYERYSILLESSGRYLEILTLVDLNPKLLSANLILAKAWVWALLAAGRNDGFMDKFDYIKTHLTNVVFRTSVGQLLGVLEFQPQALELMTLPEFALEDLTTAAKCFEFYANSGCDFANIENRFGGAASKSWLILQMARHADVTNQLDQILGQEMTHPVEQRAFPFNLLPTTHSRMDNRSKDGVLGIPVVTGAKMRAGVRAFIQLVSAMKSEGVFDVQLGNIAAARQAFAPKAGDLIQVISTGRCGTTALYELLKKSQGFLPYHSYAWQMKPGDKNHMLYRIIANQFEGDRVKALILDFVKMRTSEIIYAYAQGKTPVLTGHWDTVFAPVLSALFPQSRVIYLHRNPQATYKSLAGKNQWNKTQLQSLYFDENFTEGQFSFAFDDRLDVTQEISWYLFITKLFADAYGAEMDSAQYLNCSSDALFEGDEKAYEELSGFLADDDLSVGVMAPHFRKPINAKTDRKVVSDQVLEGEAAKVAGLIDQLQVEGRF